ncbi:hypothetical protein [Granulicella arctica]|uniref:hypothetical protein n=1 Tax=Granulicella arctica TaxID=940613 RepID=UPI0021E0D38F|nr:hypothetical protein [Granulicella arctica]
MTKFRWPFTKLLVGLIILAGTTAVAPSLMASGRSPKDYCDVVQHVRANDQKVLLVRGIYRRGGEIESFYGQACLDRSKVSWADFSKALHDKTAPAVLSELDTLLARDGRAGVLALLEFDGPKKVVVPPGTQPGLASLMRGTNSRYGHMNAFTYRVRILRIDHVESLDSSVPWPR